MRFKQKLVLIGAKAFCKANCAPYTASKSLRMLLKSKKLSYWGKKSIR